MSNSKSRPRAVKPSWSSRTEFSRYSASLYAGITTESTGGWVTWSVEPAVEERWTVRACPQSGDAGTGSHEHRARTRSVKRRVQRQRHGRAVGSDLERAWLALRP